MSRNGGTFGQIRTINSTSTSGVWDLYDEHQLISSNTWQLAKKATSVIGNSGTNLNENENTTFTVATEGFNDGDTVYYSIATVSGPALTGADFSSGSLTGSFSLSSGNGTFTIKALGDGVAENNTCKIEIRRDSVSGTIIGESIELDINDASIPTGTDISTSFYEISNRFIASNTYMGSTSDYNGPYDVGAVQTDFSGSGRVYIGVKITASTTFYNDIPIAGVQLISGSTLVASWIFNTSSGGSGSGWQTYTSQIAGSSTQGFPATPQTASGYSYSNMGTSSGTGKFSFATSTSSSSTGAADGIGNTYKLTADGGSSSIATVGDAQIAQTTSTYYAYRETSGSTRFSGTVMRSPFYTFSGGEYIRVIHAVTGPSGNQMDPDDSLYVAVY